MHSPTIKLPATGPATKGPTKGTAFNAREAIPAPIFKRLFVIAGSFIFILRKKDN